jgi:hypothetical protein
VVPSHLIGSFARFQIGERHALPRIASAASGARGDIESRSFRSEHKIAAGTFDIKAAL